MDIGLLYNCYKESTRVNTDSRSISSGDLFVALKGESFNGNDFATAALESGAVYAIVDEDRESFKGNERILLVDDGLTALQDIARHHRRQLKIPVIGLTGSNGKTTSKELLHAVLSSQYNAYATRGNLNNHIGVPLSILEINQDHEIAVIEMGANHQKEIEFLCTISMPDVGYITNIGLAHLEGFGGEEGVFKGKKELFDHLRKEQGKAFINLDDEKVVRAAESLSGTTYGQHVDANYRGSLSMNDDFLSVSWLDSESDQEYFVQTKLTGSYNFSNVMSAVAIGRYYGVPARNINKALSDYTPTNNRSQVEITSSGNHVIIDCYNANPSSMIAALENLNKVSNGKPIAILGDMLELGDESKRYHDQTLKKLDELEMEAFIVGDEFGALEKSYPHRLFFSSTEKLGEYLKKNALRKKSILLKGSRRMKLEQLFKEL